MNLQHIRSSRREPKRWACVVHKLTAAGIRDLGLQRAPMSSTFPTRDEAWEMVEVARLAGCLASLVPVP